MFAKLALRNVRRQICNYLIYSITISLSIALLFTDYNLSYSDRIQSLSELSTDIRSMFTMVTVLSCLVLIVGMGLGLSGKMTVNSVLIGALATLLVFAICMSNVAFSEKVYTDLHMGRQQHGIPGFCPETVLLLCSA